MAKSKDFPKEKRDKRRNPNPIKGRTIHLHDGEWKYKINKSNVVISSPGPNIKKYVVDLNELLNMDWESIEKGQWKGWLHITPSIIRDHIIEHFQIEKTDITQYKEKCYRDVNHLAAQPHTCPRRVEQFGGYTEDPEAVKIAEKLCNCCDACVKLCEDDI